MKSGWVLRQADARAERLSQELGVHPLLGALLVSRGLETAETARAFLEPSLDGLESPYAFRGMRSAVDRIRKAVASKEKILVYGDYDVDGVTGSAVLYPVLKSLGADAEIHIPHRMKDGYGLSRASLERLFDLKFSLLVTVDNGISAVDEIDFLNEKEIDTVIVDHHLPKERKPAACAIVSIAGGHERGDSPLAACGVAWKLAWALTDSLEAVRPLLDLVAMGTLADIAPVTGDNRILLRFGLEELRRTRRPGLSALMDVAGIDRRFIGARDIAFGLAPRINASGRMGSPLTAFKLLTTESRDEARNLAQVLDEGNRDRQKVEDGMFREAARIVERDPEWSRERVLVVSSKEWHEGVMGIVAARLCERFHRPAVVIAERDGVGKGSGRTVPGVSIHGLVSRCESMLTSFGGHDQACGLTIPAARIAEFRSALAKAARETENAAAARTVEIEAELSTRDLTADFVKSLERLEPYGPGNARPVFLTRGLRLKSAVQKRGRDTLAGWVTDAEGKAVCELVGFRCYERFNKETPKAAWDFAYKPAARTHAGITSIQLELVDWA